MPIAILVALVLGLGPTYAEINPDVFLARSQVSRVLDEPTRSRLKELGKNHPDLAHLKAEAGDPIEVFYAAVAALEERHRPRHRHQQRIDRIERGRELLEDYLGKLESGSREYTLEPAAEIVRPWSDPEGGVHVLRFFPPPAGVRRPDDLRKAAREDLDRLEQLEKESRAQLSQASKEDLELQRFVTRQARILMQFDESELLRMHARGNP